MLGVVLFSAYEDRGREVLEMVRQGVRGLAHKLKGCPPKALLEAINEVRLGRVLIDPEVTNPHSLADEFRARLTAEERPWVEERTGAIRSNSRRAKPKSLIVWRRLHDRRYRGGAGRSAAHHRA